MNKKLLYTAVGASLAAAAGVAQAQLDHDYEAMLVPYVVKDANRTTVVTVMTNSESRAKGNQDLHLQYWTKSTTDANTAACLPNSVFVPVTENDMMTFDTAGLLGYPLFGDTTNPAPNGTSISYAAPRHGYLLIDDRSDQIAGGYWMELDLANGGAHGGPAYLNDKDSSDFDGFRSQLVLRSGNSPAFDATPVNFWPSSVASTVFTVTPLGTDMLNKENNQVVMQVLNASAIQGAYDRNENGVDGTVPQTVRCVGRLTPAQLMPGVVANAAWAVQGGFGYLANLGDNASTANDLHAAVYQVDQSTAGGKFHSNATHIVSAFND